MSLDLFRVSPREAVRRFGYFVKSEPLFMPPENPRCFIVERIEGDVVSLSPVLGMGKDFFIPYMRACACSIEVPRNVPIGTLVITPPMNGCTLEIRQLNNDVNCFIHEATGVNQPLPYTAKARIEESSYSMADTPKKRALRFLENGVDAYYCHTLICIKISHDTWEIYHSQIAKDAKTGNIPYQIKQYSYDILWRFKN